MQCRPSVSIIVIGDEILKGQTKDTNSHFLCQQLHASGVRVRAISVIPDEVDTVAQEVKQHSSNSTFVLTSGGVGPTHDDVTYEGVAKAFGLKLKIHGDLKCLMPGLEDSPSSKMLFVPETSEVHKTGDPCLPIVSTRNVFMFPGIPSYLEFTFQALKHVFCAATIPYAMRELYLNVDEFRVVETLNLASREFQDIVSFGSYPYVDHRWYRMKLTLQADSKKEIVRAEAFLRSRLPENCVVGEHPPTSDNAMERLSGVRNDHSLECMTESEAILEECFRRYPVESIYLSFNGGKDCTALLHFVALYLKRTRGTIPRLKALYVGSKHPFPEVEQFIALCEKRYNLQLLKYDLPIRESLAALRSDQPELRAVLMGSRRTDPSCSQLQPFQQTDEGWPSFMRVSPLAHWTYPEVWSFLTLLDVPYCSLYDRGYSSLGCKHNTLPNDQLLTSTREGETYYLPAYLLKEPQQEREGRRT